MGGGLILRSGCALLLLVVALSGCGSGSSGSTEAAQTEAKFYPWIKGPTREFLDPKGGDNVVQTFGKEGTKAEREQASKTIAAWLAARALQDWKKDCSYFGLYRREITKDAHSVTHGKVKTCPQALAYFKHEASGDYVNTLDGPIDSLRVGIYKGQLNQGWAQYHGNDGKDWIVPLERTGKGEAWMVGIASPLNRYK